MTDLTPIKPRQKHARPTPLTYIIEGRHTCRALTVSNEASVLAEVDAVLAWDEAHGLANNLDKVT
jgi:hypothetical protein